MLSEKLNCDVMSCSLLKVLTKVFTVHATSFIILLNVFCYQIIRIIKRIN